MLTREQMTQLLGLEWVEVSLHEAVYGDTDPPRRALVGGVAPTWEEIQPLFIAGQTQSHPSLLTLEARAIHEALRRTLLPRTGYPEGFTGLQQRLLVSIMTHT